ELALLALLAWLAENGILLVPMHNREPGFRDAGCHWGPLARTNPKGGEPGPSEAQLAACRAHGKQGAEGAQRWVAGAPRGASGYRLRSRVNPSEIGTITHSTRGSAATRSLKRRIALVMSSCTDASATRPVHSTLSTRITPPGRRRARISS